MMVAAISGAISSDPVKPSKQSKLAEKNDGCLPRKPKSKQVSSRYMSPSPTTSTSTSSSRRCPSPLLLSRSTNSNSTQLPIGAPRRAQSVDRRRVNLVPELRNGDVGEVSAAAKMLITSTRRLSVSFQGEAFSLPISKTKAPVVKAAPERRRTAPVRGGGGNTKVENLNLNSKPAEQHRWPARTRQVSLSSSSSSKGVADKKVLGVGSRIVAQALEKSMVGDGRRSRSSFDGRLSLDLGNAERLSSVHRNPDANSVNQKTIVDDSRRSRSRSSFDGRLSMDLGNAERLSSVNQNPDANSVNEKPMVDDSRRSRSKSSVDGRLRLDLGNAERFTSVHRSPDGNSVNEKPMVDDSRRSRSRSSFDGRLSLDLGNAGRFSSVHRNPDANSVNEKPMVDDRATQKPMVDDSRRSRSRSSFDGRLSLDLGNAERFSSVNQNPDANSSDLTASDTESVSSGSNSGLQDGVSLSLSRGKSLPRGIPNGVSAKFWQETNSRSRTRRLQDPSSPLSSSPGSRMASSSSPAKFGPLSSPRAMASPTRGAVRSASPSKLWTSSASSPSRGNASPSKVRNSLNTCSTPSILSFSVDLRRGKVGENRVVDAHMLRLLYNRHLQWRFVNARADATSMAQKMNTEKNLWNAWLTISELRHSVTLKRIKLLLLRKKLKLTSILGGQLNYLEEWALLDSDHSSSLLGATEALRASTLRLPISGKAAADIQDLKDAIGSAVDVMHAMASSICSLSPKVEGMNCLILELANMTSKELVLLQQCKDFLSTLAAMQVKDCSLRTHILQLSRVPSTSSLTTRV